MQGFLVMNNIKVLRFILQIEAKLLLAKFVQRFNIHLDKSQSFGIMENTTLKPKDGVDVRFPSEKKECGICFHAQVHLD